MLHAVLLVLGVIWLVRLPKWKRRTAQDFPGVDSDLFQEWHEADIGFRKRFIAVVWGAFVIVNAVQIITAYTVGIGIFPVWLSDKAMPVILFALFLACIAHLMDCYKSTIRLKRAAGIPE
jgi:hypothetical protein